jgi:rRNA pseudouridine-1189 N-methylase Emg1 (Nep1/Mra1 family)
MYYNVNKGFLQTSTMCHLQTLLDRKKKLTTYFNSAQKILQDLPTLVRVTKNQNYFVIEWHILVQ